MDLRNIEPDEPGRVYDLEDEIIERLEASDDPEGEYEIVLEELYEDPDPGLYGLDLGVASTVAALSAVGCVPFASCNAGAFGGLHHERHPLVAFFAKQAAGSLLLACAEESGVGLEVEDTGTLLVYANDIRAMRRFAEVVMSREDEFPR
jgi:hypothetical protein